MPDKINPLKVVLCWHMHQPEYRDFSSGEFQLPWTYLHAIKDYVDMAAHLEATPKARAVVNFVPTLLEQISDYTEQITQFFESAKAIRDPLLAALDNPLLPGMEQQRHSLITACLRANEERLIKRFPPFAKLVRIAHFVKEDEHAQGYITEQYYADLVTWYHLAWVGETVRRSDSRVKYLLEKGGDFTLHDRRQLLEVIGELISGVIQRYQRLARQGKVELSVTPYAHPIAPLLLEIASAKEAMPEAPMPLLDAYPGGEERLRWHIEHGLAVFEKYFGFRPKGCWPAEGGVSTATMRVLSDYGFSWAATGESVLHNSLNHTANLEDGNYCKRQHMPYQVEGSSTVCFFRDDGLSDLIGFTYSDWHADDAVANLIHHLDNIARDCSDKPGSVVSIILDGENAWEYYPENGYYFLSALYRKLAEHPAIELTTFSDSLAQQVPVGGLNHLVAGSWVYGSLSTWIGDPDKNRGWDMLGDAKHVFDRVVASGRLTPQQLVAAEHQLAVCEGSDWFWWFGDYNPAESVSDFERMYRMHLSHLYQLLGEEPPEYLSHAFAHGSGAPAMGGTMRPGQAAV